MNDVTQSPAYVRAKRLIMQAFEIADTDGDRDSLSEAYAKAVFVSAMKDLISRLPQDVQEKAELTLMSSPTEEVVIELGQYMSQDQRRQIFTDNLRSTFRMYIEDNTQTFSNEQIAALEELHSSIV